MRERDTTRPPRSEVAMDPLTLCGGAATNIRNVHYWNVDETMSTRDRDGEGTILASLGSPETANPSGKAAVSGFQAALGGGARRSES